ncbi:MAG: Gfo/Idh/MocA family oxidoreductase [Chthoniobacterales bacterium]|nr:Gfo/Idh/MocA family oxidoreductase [Chthoniobacterales bacterium]
MALSKPVGIAIIGVGGIALANHLPGIALAGDRARLVAVCDTNPKTLETAKHRTGVNHAFADYHQAIACDGVDAVIVATPNVTHAEIVLAAIEARKHVLCEKPIAMNHADSLQMLRAADAANVRHMTAFTYRFVPAMRYMHHLVHSGAVGTPYHFRAQRFQDWSDRNLGWRQVKAMAATGELGDMLSHRIDYGHLLLGPVKRLVASLRRFVPTRGGQPSDLDDWVSILCDYENHNATGVLESTKLATGYGEGYGGRDAVELNGSEGSLVYSTQSPNELKVGKKNGCALETMQVPREFLAWPGSPRDPGQGDPRVSFRYDQGFEFIDAIVNQRACRLSFQEGAEAQRVMDAAVQSSEERRWIEC